MAVNNGVKLGILAAVVAGGFFLLKDANAASTDTTKTSDASSLGDIAGCSAGTADAKAGKAKASTDAIAKLASAAFTGSGLGTGSVTEFGTAFAAAYQRCYDENKTFIPGGGGSGTIVFNHSTAPFPVAAHAIAVTIGKTPAEGTGAPSSVVASDGTFKNLQAYSEYFPDAGSILANLQKMSGITPDGKYGLQTQRAFDWFYINSTN